MQYRELGNTGLKISNLGFGASSLGSVFHETKENDSIMAVEAAIEGGINFIDVSPYYGSYKAEMVLGKALKGIPRDKYYLSTKVGRYCKEGINSWDYSARRATESVYESMERLNVEYLDIINVHDIEFQTTLPGGLQKNLRGNTSCTDRIETKRNCGTCGYHRLTIEEYQMGN